MEEAWNKVFGKKAVLMIEGFPAGLEFGINCMVYETGERFQGISMIPPGLHLIYYSHLNFPRQGIFLNLQERQLFVARWEQQSEKLAPLINLDEATKLQYMQRILRGDLNTNLAPYSDQHHNIWFNLSKYLTIEGLAHAQCSVNQTIDGENDEDETNEDRKLTKLLLSNKRPSILSQLQTSSSLEEHKPQFCNFRSLESQLIQQIYQQQQIQSQSENINNQAQQLTAFELDKSLLIQHALRVYYPSHQPFSLLAELQLSFLLFMMIYSFSSLEHWKTLLNLLCQSNHFLLQYQDFTIHFIKLLFDQLKFIPEDFFTLEISQQIFLIPALTNLFSALQVTSCSESLLEHKHRFAKYINKKFNIRVISTTITTPIDHEAISIMEDSYCIMNDDEDNEEQDEENVVRRYKQKRSLETSNKMMDDDDDTRFSHSGVDQPSANIPPEISSPQQSIPIEEEEEESSSSSSYYTTPPPAIIEAENRFLASSTPLTREERERMKFSWRYPLLYEITVQSKGREDMIMAAMRILEETDTHIELQHGKLTKDEVMVREEAIKFIENEGNLLSSY
jgi:A1 cistron-splicing factor AAR2